MPPARPARRSPRRWPTRRVCKVLVTTWWTEVKPARVITYAGFTGTVREWALRISMNAKTLQSRLDRPMSLARALTMPTQPPKYLMPARVLEYQGEKATIAQWAARVG